MKTLFYVHKYFTINQSVSSDVYRNQPNTEYLNNIKVNGLAPSATRKGNTFYSIQALSAIAGAATADQALSAIAGAAIAGAAIAGAAYVATAGVATAT